MHRTILYNIPYNTDYFPATLGMEAMLELIEKGDYKNLHLNNLENRYLVNNDEDIEIPDIKHIILISSFSISKRTTFI